MPLKTARPLLNIILCLALLLGAAPAAAQQAPELTPEQQRMLDMLPAGQRSEAMRQIRQAQQQFRDRADTERDTDRERERRELDDERERELEEEEDPRDKETIRANDTLVIEVMRRPSDERTRETEPHLLAGSHTVRLDGQGRLNMPGLDDIPLAGLNGDQAAARLMAEPLLQDRLVFVTRLTLKPIGRDALEPFGYNIFQRPVETLRPLGGMPVPGDYVIGPGDSVQIQLFGQEFAQHMVTVSRDGYLHVPRIGPVAVGGMRYSQMRTDLEQRIQDQTIGIRASVSMGELRSIEVFVLGDVRRPGSYTISSLSTVLHGLYAAGGISRIGSLRDIRVIRGGEVVNTFDLYDLLLHGSARDDIRLQADDVLFVPAAQRRAGVMGETLRPAWYEIRDNATLGELVDHAGGPGLRADLTRVVIERRGDDGIPEYIDVNVASDEGRARRVRHGDVVTIPRASEVAEDAIRLRGHFVLTGHREYKDGLRLSDVLTGRGVFKDRPDLDYGLVVRRKADGRGIEVRMFSPRAVLNDPGSGDNLVLAPRDEILAFGFDDTTNRRALVRPLVERLRAQASRDAGARVVRVSGQVRAPGDYPLSEGMQVADLIRAGGGLTDSAYLDMAEITRFEIGYGQERRIEHLEVEIGRALDGEALHDVALQADDVLNVKQIPLWTERGTVELRGEVRYPGTYPIRPGEMLSDVIERAGGLTEFAFPRASVFTRQTLREREQEQIDQMAQRLEADIATAGTRQMDSEAQQAQAMARSLLEQLRNTEPAGRLVIDLERLIRNPGDEDFDVLARDGDMLVVPQRPQEVTVLGEVYFPTSHIYDPDLARTDYLSRSGGVTYRADERRIYVVRANGAVEAVGRVRGRGGQDIRPGDTIVVPIDTERVPPMVRLMNISQIVYQLGIAAAAWNNIGVF